MRVAIKSKTFRIDGNVADEFAEYCPRLGIVQERAMEALMVHGLSLSAAQFGEMLDRAAHWKESKATEVSTKQGRKGGRAE